MGQQHIWAVRWIMGFFCVYVLKLRFRVANLNFQNRWIGNMVCPCDRPEDNIIDTDRYSSNEDL